MNYSKRLLNFPLAFINKTNKLNNNFSTILSNINKNQNKIFLFNNNKKNLLLNNNFSLNFIIRGIKNKKTNKMKTIRGVFKRFTMTGHGVLKSKHSGKSHLNMNKGRRRVRSLAETVREANGRR